MIIHMIHILDLKKGKYYVSTKINNGSAWIKKYPLLHIMESHYGVDENKMTYIMMKKYGIDNVRGGIYQSMELSNTEKEYIQTEINQMILTGNELKIDRKLPCVHCDKECYTENMRDNHVSLCPSQIFSRSDHNEDEDMTNNKNFLKYQHLNALKEIWKEILATYPNDNKDERIHKYIQASVSRLNIPF